MSDEERRRRLEENLRRLEGEHRRRQQIGSRAGVGSPMPSQPRMQSPPQTRRQTFIPLTDDDFEDTPSPSPISSGSNIPPRSYPPPSRTSPQRRGQRFVPLTDDDFEPTFSGQTPTDHSSLRERSSSAHQLRGSGDLAQRFRSGLTLGSRMGSASGSGVSSQQQTEPSVRPKVRPTQITRPPEPPQYENTIPEPDIVNRYINPSTGYPDPTKLRLQNQLPRGDPRNRALELSNMSRTQINQIMSTDRMRNERKEQYLTDLNLRREAIDAKHGIYRFRPQTQSDNRWRKARRELQPYREHDRQQRDDPRFSKSIQNMDAVPVSKIGPVGRQQYGPTMRRSVSLPDLSGGNRMMELFEPTRQQQYDQRLVSLPKEERKTYKDFRKEINLYENPFARKRMVKPPTTMSIRDQDIKRVNQMAAQRHSFGSRSMSDRNESQMERRMRRDYIQRRAQLTPALSEEKKREWLQTTVKQRIPEEPNEEEEEETDSDDS